MLTFLSTTEKQAFLKELDMSLHSKSLRHTRGVCLIMIVVLWIRAEKQEEVS